MVRGSLTALIALYLTVSIGCGRPEFGTPTAAEEDVLETDVERDSPGGDADADGAPGGEAVPGGPEDREAPNNDSPVITGDASYQPDGDFAFAAYHALAQQGRNAVFAPHGLARTLVIAHAAVDANHAGEVAAVLAPYLGTDLYAAFNAADLEVETRESADRLQLVGSVWAHNDVEVSADFVDILARYLGLRIRLLDFEASPEDARNTINNWHSGETGGRLTEVLGPRTIHAATRFVVTDAAWFAARWGFGGFDPANTTYEPFAGTERDVVVPMMRAAASVPVVEGPDFDAVVLPYEGDFSLLAVVPDDLLAFEQNLDPDFFARLSGEATPRPVDLRFPRIEVSDRVSLSDIAESLELQGLFEDASYPAFLDGTAFEDAFQRTRISFSEEGTTVEAVDNDGTASPAAPEAVAISFDRPFVFAIRDTRTDRLLFVGRVAQPE